MSATAPFIYSGPGCIEYFHGGNKTFRNLEFKHHCVLRNQQLVVDGCVFAEWEIGEDVWCKFVGDSDETTDELSE
jgi:hypothetical protein